MFSEVVISERLVVQERKKRTLKDIIGLVEKEGDAVKSKKSLQKGLK